MIPQIGIHENVPFDVYQSWEALNNSLLKEITRSPGHLAYRRDNPIKVTPAMQFGSAVDCLLFDGVDAFARAYQMPPQRPEELPAGFVLPPDPLPTKANGEPYKDFWASKPGKEWIADQFARGNTLVKDSDWNGGGLNLLTIAGQAWKEYAEANGITVVSHMERNRIRSCVEAVENYPLAAEILASGKPQLSVVWCDKETEILCKMRLDWYDSPIITDLKTTGDADPESYGKMMANFQGHWQPAWYCDGMTVATGIPHDEFKYIVAEAEPPHRVEVMRLGMAELEMGRAEYRDALRLYAECAKNNHWPTSSGTVQALSFPGWAFR